MGLGSCPNCIDIIAYYCKLWFEGLKLLSKKLRIFPIASLIPKLMTSAF